MASTNNNELSFTVIAPQNNKNKAVFILDEDDADEYFDNVPIIIMDTSPPMGRTVERSSYLSSSSSTTHHQCLLGPGMQSFDDCSQLQRELLSLQESLFQGMTQKVLDAQEQVLAVATRDGSTEIRVGNDPYLTTRRKGKESNVLDGISASLPYD